MRLELPNVRYGESFREALREHQAEGEMLGLDPEMPEEFLHRYVERLLLAMYGKALDRKESPATTYWLLNKMEYIASFRMTDSSTPGMEGQSGEIEWSVRPSLRGSKEVEDTIERITSTAREAGLTTLIIREQPGPHIPRGAGGRHP